MLFYLSEAFPWKSVIPEVANKSSLSCGVVRESVCTESGRKTSQITLFD